MSRKKKSFFERLTGTVSLDEDFDAFDDERSQPEETVPTRNAQDEYEEPLAEEEQADEGQLPVDVYQSENEIIIRTLVAGVKADGLDISINRDMVTVSGAREPREEVDPGDYFHQELYWGAFSRTILLPEEIDVDGASASSKDGLLTIILPKLDKSKQTKLKVKSG